jgi:hypothetical protein
MRKTILFAAPAAVIAAIAGAFWIVGSVPAVAPPPVVAERPRISPHESISAMVDGARMEIVYGRPYMRGRKIFGGLVPYGRVWCPGADEATTLESTRELEIGSIRVPAGPHTIWILPTPERWTLIISREPHGFHTQYDSRADLGRIDLHKRELPSPVEQLTFAIEPTQDGGTISMAWENTQVSIPFKVVR